MVYFNWWFALFFFVVNLLLFMYKGEGEWGRLVTLWLSSDNRQRIINSVQILLPSWSTGVGAVNDLHAPDTWALQAVLRWVQCGDGRRHGFPHLPGPPRTYSVSKGNKTEQIIPLLWALALDVPVLVGYSYYIDLQTYMWERLDLLPACRCDVMIMLMKTIFALCSLRVDLILNAIGIVFVGLESFACVLTGFSFYSSFRG
jgi:hypothetical protein